VASSGLRDSPHRVITVVAARPESAWKMASGLVEKSVPALSSCAGRRAQLRLSTIMAMRKWLLVFCLLLLASSSFLLAERVQDLPKPTNYVSDFAGVLSPETQASLNALCAQVDRQAHAQIAVVKRALTGACY
jgi:hypothetical protein